MQPNQTPQPRPVITSKAAKDHLFQAKKLMDETYSNIVMQRNRLNLMSAQRNQQNLDQQKVQQKFQQDRIINQEKVNAVNPLS